MPDAQQFYQTHKFKALEEHVLGLVHALKAPADQTTYDGNEINQKGNEFWVNFFFSFHNDSVLTVRCDFHYQGQCSSLEQIHFL
jgi:hypothetical protein